MLPNATDNRSTQHPHLLQLRQWGVLKARHGWGVATASSPSAHSQLLLRRFPFGRLAYVPRGPCVDWHTPALVAPLLQATLAQARQQCAFAVVIEPDLPDTPAHQTLLREHGWQPLDFYVQPRRSIMVNLNVADENSVLAAMKQKTRYNIGLAKRKNVSTRIGTLKDAPLFHQMMQTTAERDGFGVHTLAYYQDVIQLFCGADGSAQLLIAEHEGKPLASLVVTAVGQCGIYLYGASTNENRELMPTYLLQWEAMRWARSKGCTQYDLWGIPDEDEATLEAQFETRHDGLWGVYRFKRGFGGQVVRTVGAWVRVLAPLQWQAYTWARRLRKTTGLSG